MMRPARIATALTLVIALAAFATGVSGEATRPVVVGAQPAGEILTPGTLVNSNDIHVFPSLSHSGQHVALTGVREDKDPSAESRVASPTAWGTGLIDRDGIDVGLVPGQLGAVSGDGCSFVWVEFDRLSLRNLCANPGQVEDIDLDAGYGSFPPSVSFDGSSVTVVRQGNRYEIAHFSRSTSGQWLSRSWTGPRTGEFQPPSLRPTGEVDISDDGSTVVFAARRSGSGLADCSEVGGGIRASLSDHIMVWEPATEGEPTELMGPNGDVDGRFIGHPSISGDGQWIAFTGFGTARDKGEAVQVWLAQRGGEMRVVRQNASFPNLSADGSHLSMVDSANPCFAPSPSRSPVAAAGVIQSELDVLVASGTGPGLAGTVSIEPIGSLHVGLVLPYNLPVISELGRWVVLPEPTFVESGTVLTGAHLVAYERPARIQIEPVEFGTVAAGTTRNLSTTLFNAGPSSVRLSETTFSGLSFAAAGANCDGGFLHADGTCSFESAFSVSATSCIGVILYPEGTCTIDVSFTAPDVALNFDDVTLILSETGFRPASGSTSVTAAVSEPADENPPVVDDPTVTPVPPLPLPRIGLQFEPAALDFGALVLGSDRLMGAQLVNTGDQEVKVALSVNSDVFTVATEACSESALPPGAACDLQLRFAPVAEGTFAGQLFADAGQAQATLPLTGSGVAPTVGLSITPNALAFPITPVGSRSAPETVVVTNSGTADTPVILSLGGDARREFEIGESDCAGRTLIPGDSCRVELRFAPRSVGQHLGELRINGGTTPEDRAALSGVGSEEPTLRVSPNAVTDRTTAVIFGRGFPPNSIQLLVIEPGGIGVRAVADAAGDLRVEFSPFDRLLPGAHDVGVVDLDGSITPEGPSAPFAVVPNSAQPSANVGPGFSALTPGRTLLYRN